MIPAHMIIPRKLKKEDTSTYDNTTESRDNNVSNHKNEDTGIYDNTTEVSDNTTEA